MIDLLVPSGSGWGSGACLPSSFFGSGACLPSSLFLVLFHHDLLVPPGSGWRSGACLPSSLCFLSSGKGFCSIMICWFLLVPAGVPVLVFLLLSSLVPVLVSLLLSSFLRKGFLFHHDLLAPPGSGWGSGACLPSSRFFGSGACLPSSLFFLSSGQGFCSIMICWFLLVPDGVPVLVSLLLSSLVPVLVSLLLSSFFPQEEVLFHHDLLAPPGSGWGSGACLPSSLFFGSVACLPSSLFFVSSGKGFCSIMICWFLLVPAGVPVLAGTL